MYQRLCHHALITGIRTNYVRRYFVLVTKKKKPNQTKGIIFHPFPFSQIQLPSGNRTVMRVRCILPLKTSFTLLSCNTVYQLCNKKYRIKENLKFSALVTFSYLDLLYNITLPISHAVLYYCVLPIAHIGYFQV